MKKFNLESIFSGRSTLEFWGKVIFSGYIFTGVCDSVHRGVSAPGGCLLPGGSAPGWCLLLGVAAPGGRVCCWGVPGPGGGAWWRPSPPDGCCCGRYASYWNAFLFSYEICQLILFTK